MDDIEKIKKIFEKTGMEPKSIDEGFETLMKEVQKKDKPINVIDSKECNFLLGGSFKNMLGVAEIEGHLVNLPVKGVANREAMIISSAGQGLRFQQATLEESGKIFSDYQLFGKNETKRRLENALKFYPERIKDIEETLDAGRLSANAKKEAEAYLRQLRFSEGRCKKLLEEVFDR